MINTPVLLSGASSSTPPQSKPISVNATIKDVSYLAMVVGNDPFPRPHLAEKLKNQYQAKNKGNFIFVGTCGLQSLEWIYLMAGAPSTTIFPQLYVIDFSRDVQTFWKIMKEIMEKADIYEKFEPQLKARTMEIWACSDNEAGDSVQMIKEFMAKLTTPAVTGNADISQEKIYAYLRTIIMKASIICENWGNEKVFRLINATRPKDEHGKPYPAIVSSGNILELVGGGFCDGKELVDIINNNIKLLNPTFGIYTRTSLERSKKLAIEAGADPKKSFHFGPDALIIAEEEDFNDNILQALQNEKYVPLVSYRALANEVPSASSDAAASKKGKNKKQNI